MLVLAATNVDSRQSVSAPPSLTGFICHLSSVQGRPKAPPVTQNVRNPRVGNKIKKVGGGAKVKFDQLINRKIIKIVVTRCHILRLKCIKFDFSWGSAPDPTGGAHSAPPDHFVVSKNSAAHRLTDILQCGLHPQMSLRPVC